MSEINISADLSEAIEKISEKIGIASTAIIPEYSKQFKIKGIIWAIGGIVLATLPWFVIPESVDLSIMYKNSYSKDGQYFWQYVYVFIRWAACLSLTWGGLYTVFDCVENIITSKSMAINRLLNQVRR